ncbi:MAG: DUF6491 family protein [Pseudomonadota bacterium]
MDGGLLLLLRNESKQEGRTKLPKTTKDCVLVRNVHDWRALDRYNLIIWAPSRSRPYHVELDVPCMPLPFAETIGISSRDNRLCGFGGDAILVRHQRCPVGAIKPIDKTGLEALLVKFGKKKPKADKPKAIDTAVQ